jgi:hypothetical protein
MQFKCKLLSFYITYIVCRRNIVYKKAAWQKLGSPLKNCKENAWREFCMPNFGVHAFFSCFIKYASTEYLANSEEFE